MKVNCDIIALYRIFFIFSFDDRRGTLLKKDPVYSCHVRLPTLSHLRLITYMYTNYVYRWEHNANELPLNLEKTASKVKEYIEKTLSFKLNSGSTKISLRPFVNHIASY